MTNPRCIRCNRPILPAEDRHSRQGATRRSYWHARQCVEVEAVAAPVQQALYGGDALRESRGRRVRPAPGADKVGRR